MHRVQFTNYCMLAPVVACVQTRAELVVWGRSPQWREGNGSGGGGLHSDEGTRLLVPGKRREQWIHLVHRFGDPNSSRMSAWWLPSP